MDRERENFYLGLDVGSVSLKTVALDGSGRIRFEDYRRTNGRPFQTAAAVLRQVREIIPDEVVAGVAVTGTGGRKLAEALGGRFINEIIALSLGVSGAAPEVRTAIEIGGQDSKLLLFDADRAGEPDARPVLRDFSMNSLCAAGTGSFLDQQATRLGVAIEEEFGALALRSENPPRIAGRCSVFAKSDMIHLQQIATPVHDIAAGLCVALARSFKSTVGKGKAFHKPIAFLGGVASNAGMAAAFERVLELAPGELLIPPHHRTLGAYGAALSLLNEGGAAFGDGSRQDTGETCRRDAGATIQGCSLAVKTCGVEVLPDRGNGSQNKPVCLGCASGTPEPSPPLSYRGVAGLEACLSRTDRETHASLRPLRPFLTPAGTPDVGLTPIPDTDGKIVAYIGIDVGSVSTNVVAIDGQNRLLAKQYLWTASRPIEAVRRGLEEIRREIGDRIIVRGAGTTGSGRYLIGEMVGADVIRNEITAQATAALLIDPKVDTIFEIGGQDSKYISIDHGAVCDFEMNKACAAGTGSFLSEQAERLGINLETEFGPLALDAPNPVPLGDRCTVFMESDLIHHQQRGAEMPNLLAGLAYSIVHNYLNRVVGDRRVGERVFFQGGTAYNKAVVAAFNAVLEKEVVVPPHHEVTGAIGVAMLAREKVAGPTRFRGFDFSTLNYDVKTFVCKSCDNRCEIRQVRLEGERPLYYGSRCEKYDVDRHAAQTREIPDLFGEREQALLRSQESGDRSQETEFRIQNSEVRIQNSEVRIQKSEFRSQEPGVRSQETETRNPKPEPRNPQSAIRNPKSEIKGRVALPLALSFHDLLPFWRAFFETLGFEVVLSGPTTKFTIQKGVESVVNETCFPIKIAQGHLIELLEKLDPQTDILFLPSLIDAQTEEFGRRDRPVYNCPLVQTFPYTARSGIDFESRGIRVLSPALHMQWGPRYIAEAFSEHRGLLRAGRAEIRRALESAEAAQKTFYDALERRGKETLDNLKGDQVGLVIVSRPYNGCDLGLNLDLPRKIRNLGALPIPMDMLPLRSTPLPERWRKVYWRYGQRIMKAAQIIKHHPNLFAVYITNFSCGPDSFLLEYFRAEMAGKPHLLLEIDEHSADAGLITRCEAFLDTLANLARHGGSRVAPDTPYAPRRFTNHRRVYLPNMSPHAHPLAAAIRSVGVQAEVMAPSDDESVYWGERFTSGRECYPCLLTTGDMVRQTRRLDFDPKKSAFFMASTDGPCRFGQYNQLQRNVLDRLGLGNVPIFALEQDLEYREAVKQMGSRFERRAWIGVVAVDALEKLLHEKRPYEKVSGQTEKWFWDSVRRVCEVIEKSAARIWDLLPELVRQYDAISFDNEPRRPIIGVVGEVYVRTNAFANRDLVKAIEALGGEAAVPTMSEWIRYTRFCRADRNRIWRLYGKMLMDALSDFVLSGDEKRVYRAFRKKPDAPPTHVFELARPYLDPSFQGEAILTIGKAIEFIHAGAAGIVNTMPFTCMPGSICAALFKRVREDHGEIPLLNLAFTGQQTTNNQARLEAFLFQAREYHERSQRESRFLAGETEKPAACLPKHE